MIEDLTRIGFLTGFSSDPVGTPVARPVSEPDPHKNGSKEPLGWRYDSWGANPSRRFLARASGFVRVPGSMRL